MCLLQARDSTRHDVIARRLRRRSSARSASVSGRGSREDLGDDAQSAARQNNGHVGGDQKLSG
jgi:hypothetical protein